VFNRPSYLTSQQHGLIPYTAAQQLRCSGLKETAGVEFKISATADRSRYAASFWWVGRSFLLTHLLVFDTQVM
jgi:hypothetical protein